MVSGSWLPCTSRSSTSPPTPPTICHYKSCVPVLLSALGMLECIGNEYLAEVCTRGARSVGCCDRVTLTKALLNKTFEVRAKKK